MTHIRIKKSNEKYEIIEPLNNFSESYGYMMIVDNKGKVIRFYRSGARREAEKYFDYISLSRLGKLKYWLNYKRGG